MIPIEILQEHYREYSMKPDEWVIDREKAKRSIVEHVIRETGFRPGTNPVRVTVLGASDKRYLPVHKRIFKAILGTPVKMTTLDIDVNHLGGKSEEVVEHDVTTELPGSYDIIFSHELMKFLTAEEQITTMKNSYHALSEDGLAMHIMHAPSIKGTPELRTWQYRVNPDSLLEQLKRDGIPATKLVFNSKTDVDWLRETTVIAISRES